jgi:hypothetical protein
MSLVAVLAAIIVPILVQIACLFVVSSVDPCNSNPGCMAGTMTSYVAIFVLPASLLVLVIATIIEWATGKVSGRTALIINVCLALIPFALIFGLLLA